MADHPAITDPEYSTTVACWYDGGLHFFTRVPADAEGINFFNVYHLAYGIIFALALWLCQRWWRQGSFRVRKRLVLDSILVAIAAIVIGGRLGEAIFYQPEYFFSQPTRLLTNASGFTIHGMIIGVILAFWAWGRWIKRPMFHLLDQACMFVAIGTPLGRIANFMGGDLWGRETGGDWGVRFLMRGPLFRRVYADNTGQTYVLVRETPEQSLLDSLNPFAEAPDSRLWLEPWTPDQGYQILDNKVYDYYPMGDPEGAMQVVQTVVTTPRHPSQLYQALAEGVVLAIFLFVMRGRTKHVGELSAWFLIGYGVLRTCTEAFRQPEPGLGYLLGLTRGQALSLAMVAGGAVLLYFSRRRKLRIDSIATDAPGHTPQVQPAETPQAKAAEASASDVARNS